VTMRPNMIVRATRRSVIALPYDELSHWFAKIGNISRSMFNQGAYARVDDVRAVSVLPATERTLMLIQADGPARAVPGDVVVFVEITESILSDESPDDRARARLAADVPRTEDCCVSSTAGRSLMHVGDTWECERGHRWRVDVPGRAVRADPPG